MVPYTHLAKSLLDNLFEGIYFVDRACQVTYWSVGAHKLTGHASWEVSGKTCRENMIMHVDKWGHNLCGTDSCPAKKTMADGRVREICVSYHHKEGHLVPAVARFFPLRDENQEIIGAVEAFSDTTPVMVERQKAEQLEKLALVDPLTKVANRRGAEIRLNAKVSEFNRYAWPFGVLFIDVDGFKPVNDRLGHRAGDQVLKAVARTLSGNLRDSDFVARWGGDEFLVILGHASDGAIQLVADKLCRMVAQSIVSIEQDDVCEMACVTASVGAVLMEPDLTADTLLKRADEAMYQSKKAGKNRVTVWGAAA